MQEYLAEKDYPTIDEITDNNLPDVLYNFYSETCKKKPNPDTGDEQEYKNSTLKCVRAALNRYFKEKRCVDIIVDGCFIKTNEMFKAVTKINKEEGRGDVEDLKTLGTYFENNMQGPPNAEKLLEIVLFNVIYHMGCGGRQNLRNMKKITLQ